MSKLGNAAIANAIAKSIFNFGDGDITAKVIALDNGTIEVRWTGFSRPGYVAIDLGGMHPVVTVDGRNVDAPDTQVVLRDDCNIIIE